MLRLTCRLGFRVGLNNARFLRVLAARPYRRHPCLHHRVPLAACPKSGATGGLSASA